MYPVDSLSSRWSQSVDKMSRMNNSTTSTALPHTLLSFSSYFNTVKVDPKKQVKNGKGKTNVPT